METSKEMAPRVRSVLLCDDVRQEASGKEILIGVYSGGIRVFKPAPAKLRQLCFRIEMTLDTTRQFQIRFIAPSGTVIFDEVREMPTDEPAKGIVILQRLDVVLYESGTYRIMAGFDGNLEEIDTTEVSFGTAEQQSDQVTADSTS